MVSRVVVGQGGLGVGMRFLDEGVCGCRHKLRGETDHYKLGATEAVLATQSLVVGWLIKECRLACHLERARECVSLHMTGPEFLLGIFILRLKSRAVLPQAAVKCRLHHAPKASDLDFDGRTLGD